MKLQELQKGTMFITSPIQVVRAKGWKKGNDIVCEINKEGDLVLKKK